MIHRIIGVAAFTLLSALWLAFGTTLIFNRDLLTDAWQLLGTWPPVAQWAAWLLALPVVLGLWVWQTSSPVLVRVGLVAGLAGISIFTFLPWKPSRRPASAVKGS